MPLVGYALVEPVWGWSIRPPLASVSGASYLLPPPSTILGALLAAEGAWRELEVREGRLVSPLAAAREWARSASAGLVSGALIQSYDVARVSNIPYLKPENRRDPGQWFGITGFGVTYAVASSATRLCVAVVAEGLSPRRLEAMLWGLARLGSKESLVSVVDVEVADAVLDEGETRLYGLGLDCPDCPTLDYWHPFDPNAVEVRVGKKGGAPRLITARAPLSKRGFAVVPYEDMVPVERCWVPRGSRLYEVCGCVPLTWG